MTGSTSPGGGTGIGAGTGGTGAGWFTVSTASIFLELYPRVAA